ncbi:MAG: hypothetical protein JZD40_01985, partial [Sulfolobus sp.]|nr:hypothetical protein [Sulfolobus sp.]
MIKEEDREFLEQELVKAGEFLPESITQDLRNSILNYPVTLTREEIEKIIQLSISEYTAEFASPGEPVGIVAAQSIGERIYRGYSTRTLPHFKEG